MEILLKLSWLIITVLAMLIIAGCVAAGGGRSSLVLHPATSEIDKEKSEFSHFVNGTDETLVIPIEGTKGFTPNQWGSFEANRFKSRQELVQGAAIVAVSVRDRTRTPAMNYYNFDVEQVDAVIKIQTNEKLSEAEKRQQIDAIRYNFSTLPETVRRTVFDRQEKKADESGDDERNFSVSTYFVEITADLAGFIQTGDPLDRFSYMAVAIRIPEDSPARFVNFSPKPGDLFEYTIGELKQSGSVKSNASVERDSSLGASSEDKATENQTSGTTSSNSTKTSYGLDLSLSEDLTREIKSSLEARSAGFVSPDKVFIAELRSNDLRRIAGTYSFNIMIEVPSNLERNPPGNNIIFGESDPRTKAIDFDVRTIGVVRHVKKRGFTGWLNKLPESTNDHTFHNVIIQDTKIEAWRFSNRPQVEIAATPPPSHNVTINTSNAGAGNKQATYAIVNPSDEKILFRGAGAQSNFSIPENTDFKVVFHPVTDVDGAVITYTAPESPIYSLALGEDQKILIEGIYTPTSVQSLGSQN